MVYIPKIKVNATLHISNIARFTTQSVDLRPSSHARLHVMTPEVTIDDFPVGPVVDYGMRTWPTQETSHLSIRSAVEGVHRRWSS